MAVAVFCISAVYFLTSVFWTIQTNSTAEQQPECEVGLIWVVVVVAFLVNYTSPNWTLEEILEKKNNQKTNLGWKQTHNKENNDIPHDFLSYGLI